MQNLVLERRWVTPEGQHIVMSNGTEILLPPMVDEDYWSYRVQLTDQQAVVGFPKFTTIGIGFAAEEDWNTNLPYTCDAERIRQHIWHNRGKSIPKSDESKARVRAAIEMIQAAVAKDKEG